MTKARVNSTRKNKSKLGDFEDIKFALRTITVFDKQLYSENVSSKILLVVLTVLSNRFLCPTNLNF